MCVYPENIEPKIDFSTIRTQLMGACSSVLGREQVEQITFLTDKERILFLLRETEELGHIMSDSSLDFPRGEIADVREAVGRIRVVGLYLNEQELFDLRKTLDYAGRLDEFFRHLDANRFPIWSSLSLELRVESVEKPSSLKVESLKEILKVIDRVIDRYGQLSDSASPELARIRKDLRQAQGSANRALMGILRQAQAEGIVDKDVAPTMREGRLVIPVSPAYKRKLGGIVHDESATGKTVYVEPQQVVEANNRIRELEGEEGRERIRILQAVSGILRDQMPAIHEAERLLAHVDFVRAKVIVAQQQKAIMPQFSDSQMIDLRQVVNPVLALKKAVVPLDIKLKKENRVLVISGPNAGGKSVCLKTVGLLQYMLQCGLLVPLREDSTMSVFDHLMIDIGDEQSMEDDLSTYSSHLRNMKAFVRYANEKTLLLIDEFGTGTEPLLGGAIAEAVLSQLVTQGAFGVITTHYTNLKHFAEVTEGVQN
ncbi:MAG: endonuclease MutS2, partial [Paludibacteraceae bacterium]|nr:endonuclease MutS2 [Paludibacteraceae bacterium]